MAGWDLWDTKDTRVLIQGKAGMPEGRNRLPTSAGEGDPGCSLRLDLGLLLGWGKNRPREGGMELVVF